MNLKASLCALAPLIVGACETSHSVPEHPTWADVEPILRAECLHCHGGSAPLTGSAGDRVYRFDFFDVTSEVCGEAAAAVDLPTFAAGSSSLIANSVASIDRTVRPRMPPAPSASLADWEWQTILRWAADPQKGVVRPGNQPPTVRLMNDNRSIDKRLSFWAIVEDADGESAVGILTIGDFQLKMDRPGAFVVDVDSSNWPAGDVPIRAVVCDGWANVTYGLGDVSVQHKK